MKYFQSTLFLIIFFQVEKHVNDDCGANKVHCTYYEAGCLHMVSWFNFTSTEEKWNIENFRTSKANTESASYKFHYELEWPLGQ